MARDTGKLLERALADASNARDDLRRARGNVRRYRGKAAKTRARNAVVRAERKLDLAVNRVDKYATVAAREEAPPRRETEPGSKEWEIGLSYGGTRRQGNAVDINFRLYRTSGKLITKREAADAIKHLHEGGSSNRMPHGIQVEGVNWRRPGWSRERHGTPNDLKSFSSIMQTTFLGEFRLGSVEPDE